MRLLLAAAALSCCWLGSCAAKPPRRYQLRGEVVSLDPQGNIAKIRNQKIEGWMDAMTMEFPVKDAGELKSLQPGDCITATVFVQDLNYWIGEIQHAPGTCVSTPP